MIRKLLFAIYKPEEILKMSANGSQNRDSAYIGVPKKVKQAMKCWFNALKNLLSFYFDSNVINLFITYCVYIQNSIADYSDYYLRPNQQLNFKQIDTVITNACGTKRNLRLDEAVAKAQKEKDEARQLAAIEQRVREEIARDRAEREPEIQRRIREAVARDRAEREAEIQYRIQEAIARDRFERNRN